MFRYASLTSNKVSNYSCTREYDYFASDEWKVGCVCGRLWAGWVGCRVKLCVLVLLTARCIGHTVHTNIPVYDIDNCWKKKGLSSLVTLKEEISRGKVR